MASASIGEFEIGVSAIGVGEFDWTGTILSQYANSPTLLALIENFFGAVDSTQKINDFFDKVWNIVTAEGYGLDIWGRIVNVGRVLTLPIIDEALGFEEGGTVDYKPFGEVVFYSGIPASSNYTLADDAYRVLILAKALSNISACSIQSYNTLLTQLFAGRGNAFVSDTGNMTAQLIFFFALQPFEVAILKHSGAIADPTGVLFNIMQVDYPYGFGFEEAAAAGFNVGTFFGGFL